MAWRGAVQHACMQANARAGRSDLGRNYLGHTDLGHNYLGHNYLDHTYLGHNYQANARAGRSDDTGTVRCVCEPVDW